MGFIELLLIAVGLSMDAFAVAVCKGLSVGKLGWRHFLAVGLWFGGFQALMPAIGYLLGTTFEKYITSVDHWVAFVLLGLIGGNMLKEGFSREEEKEENTSFGFRAMLPLAVATSIAALAVGITFPLLRKANFFSPACPLGATSPYSPLSAHKVGHIFAPN